MFEMARGEILKILTMLQVIICHCHVRQQASEIDFSNNIVQRTQVYFTYEIYVLQKLVQLMLVFCRHAFKKGFYLILYSFSFTRYRYLIVTELC